MKEKRDGAMSAVALWMIEQNVGAGDFSIPHPNYVSLPDGGASVSANHGRAGEWARMVVARVESERLSMSTSEPSAPRARSASL